MRSVPNHLIEEWKRHPVTAALFKHFEENYNAEQTLLNNANVDHFWIAKGRAQIIHIIKNPKAFLEITEGETWQDM